MMELDRVGADFILGLEGGPTGAQLKVYRDAAGLACIGFGHKLTAEEVANKTFEAGISARAAKELFRADAKAAEDAVNAVIQAPLAQHQFDALVGFVFNMGPQAFSSSRLVSLVNEGQLEAVPAELLKWQFFTDPKTQRKVLAGGLLKRRKAEADLWQAPPPPAPVSEEDVPRRRRRRIARAPRPEVAAPVTQAAPEPSPAAVQATGDLRRVDALLNAMLEGFLRGVARGLRT